MTSRVYRHSVFGCQVRGDLTFSCAHEALTAAPLQYIHGLLVRDKVIPVGYFRVEEEHLAGIRPGVQHPVSVPLLSVLPKETAASTNAPPKSRPMVESKEEGGGIEGSSGLGVLQLSIAASVIDVTASAGSATSPITLTIEVFGVK